MHVCTCVCVSQVRELVEHLQKEEDSGSAIIDPSQIVLNVEPVSATPERVWVGRGMWLGWGMWVG